MIFVAWMERSDIRGQPFGWAPPSPDFAALNPGYAAATAYLCEHSDHETDQPIAG